MENKFSIISYYDPYGDLKSTRKVLSRKNYRSSKTLSEVEAIIKEYNGISYYNAVRVGSFDNRSKNIKDFDKSYFINSKAPKANYTNIF